MLTAADTLLFLVFHHLGHRVMEFFIFVLMFIISMCFIVEMFYSKPVVSEVLLGLIPTLPPGSLAFATGILGATIMPHKCVVFVFVFFLQFFNTKQKHLFLQYLFTLGHYFNKKIFQCWTNQAQYCIRRFGWLLLFKCGSLCQCINFDRSRCNFLQQGKQATSHSRRLCDAQ